MDDECGELRGKSFDNEKGELGRRTLGPRSYLCPGTNGKDLCFACFSATSSEVVRASWWSRTADVPLRFLGHDRGGVDGYQDPGDPIAAVGCRRLVTQDLQRKERNHGPWCTSSSNGGPDWWPSPGRAKSDRKAKSQTSPTRR